MVFKRPAGSRDDKPKNSSGRGSRGDDKPKRSASASKGKATPNGEKKKLSRPDKPFQSNRFSDDKPKSSFSAGASGGKSSARSRPYTGRPAADSPSGEGKGFSQRSKPYSGRPTGDADQPKRNFGSASSGERKPYGSRSSASFEGKPKRSFGGEQTGDKKPYSSPRTRSASAGSEDRPKRSFGGEQTGDKKPYSSPRTRSASTGSEDRPKRNFGGAESTGDKKPYSSPRTRSSAGSEDRPKRSFGGSEQTGERKFGAGSGPRERSGEKKFTGRSTGEGFKKREGDFSKDKPYSADRPERPKPTYDKITRDLDAPVKTLRGRKKPAEGKDDGLIRLNRYISNAGICSRRKADELIIAGVVAVNGVVVNELGTKIDPMKDEIKYNGETLKREKMVYVLLNKPKDYITTTEDPQERRTVMHLIEKATRERIYPVGRLDRNTTGLLLMTNDGDLADKLSHPRNSITKLYQVELNKSLTQGDMNKIGFGIDLEDGLIKPDSVSYVAGGSKREIGIQIHSGKNRVVRRIFEHLGYEVVKLDRVVYANLTKKDLPRGRWRFLEEKEIIQLKHLI